MDTDQPSSVGTPFSPFSHRLLSSGMITARCGSWINPRASAIEVDCFGRLNPCASVSSVVSGEIDSNPAQSFVRAWSCSAVRVGSRCVAPPSLSFAESRACWLRSLIGLHANRFTFPFWGCSGFYPWLECAAACREPKASRKSPFETNNRQTRRDAIGCLTRRPRWFGDTC